MWWLMLACSEPVAPASDLDERVAQRLRSRMADHVVTVVGAGQIQLVTPQDHVVDLWTHQLTKTCEATPDRCEQEMTAWIDRVGRRSQATAEPLNLERLRPQVFAKAEADQLELPSEPLAGDLVVVLVQDGERMSRLVDPEELSPLGVTLEQARETAWLLFREGGEPARQADRLLLDDWDEGTVALAVAPDTLVVGTLDEVQAHPQVERPLSRTPLVRSAMKWEPVR